MTQLQNFPSRIKYYLLEWKDRHMDKYIELHGKTPLNDLQYGQIVNLFNYATEQDKKLLL